MADSEHKESCGIVFSKTFPEITVKAFEDAVKRASDAEDRCVMLEAEANKAIQLNEELTAMRIENARLKGAYEAEKYKTARQQDELNAATTRQQTTQENYREIIEMLLEKIADLSR